MSISEANFRYLQGLVKSRTRICLGDDKQYLVVSRLGKMVADRRYASVDQLIEKARGSTEGPGLANALVEALIIHETFFFRDPPFGDVLKQIIAALQVQNVRRKNLNIWSAACSTGQEAYSAALLLKEQLPSFADWHLAILATDYSETALKKAKSASYSMAEVNRGLPAAMLMRYFHQSGIVWQLRDEIRSMVEFRRLNLVESWPLMPRQDLILLRNVLIYFDHETRLDILDRIRRQMSPVGYLVLGASESLDKETGFIMDSEIRRIPCYRPA